MNKYALLISGGIDEEHNFVRYSNDLGYIYDVLINKLSYIKDNIEIFYADGRNLIYVKDSENTFIVNTNAATSNNILNKLLHYKNIVNEDDLLFIIISNHGDLQNNQEAIINMWTSYDTLSQTIFAQYLNNINCKKIIVQGQCYSGNALQINVDNSITISGNEKNMPTLACDDYEYDEFLYHFISYYNGNYPNKGKLNIINDNLSIESAFDYAKNNDKYHIQPCIISVNKRNLYLYENPTMKCVQCDPREITL
ncbi:MAG: Peptidase family [Clostridiaceae bacterium]|jgi:hypothetical protein|nr:Peptidase family [Clostridiaceae bacterium]